MMKPWKHLKESRLVQRIVLGLTFLALSVGLVFIPTAWDPYVRVPGNTIALQIDCVASDIYLQLRNAHLQAQRAELVARDLNGKIRAERFPMHLHNTPGGNVVHLSLSQTNQQNAREYLNRMDRGGNKVFTVIEFARTPSISINSARVLVSDQYTTTTCEDQEINAEQLKIALDASDAQLIRYRRPQDAISDGILQANDLVGSIVLAGMIVISCWLLWHTSAGFVQAYISGKDAMACRLAGTNAEAVRTKFHLAERYFMFWRVVGPALGFILTISSLVEGLHPSRQGSQDSFLLVSALQLALVATFLGLWIRILSEFAIRFHRAAAERRLVFLSTLKHSGASNAP